MIHSPFYFCHRSFIVLIDHVGKKKKKQEKTRKKIKKEEEKENLISVDNHSRSMKNDQEMHIASLLNPFYNMHRI